MNRPIPGDDPVTQDLLVSERFVGGPVRNEAIHFDEGIFVQEERHALTGEQLALHLLGMESGFPAAELHLPAQGLEMFQLLVHGHPPTPALEGC